MPTATAPPAPTASGRRAVLRPAPPSLPTGWRSDAQCKADIASDFFPPAHFERKPEKDAREQAARAVCRRCPVRQECLEYALAVAEPYGIWGGLNELERRRLLRTRRGG